MKYRVGFVSNSSSCSFTCEACGTEEGGINLCLEEAYMAECECGHTICFPCIGHDPDDVYNLPKEECPCCNLIKVADYTVTRYALHLLGKSKEDLVAEIKEKFETEEDLWKEINNES